MGLEKISLLRKQKGISLDELSVKSGIPIGTLSKISAGITKDPKLETIKSIARALECSLDEFDDYQVSKPFSKHEEELINKYRMLSDHAKELINLIIDKELELQSQEQ